MKKRHVSKLKFHTIFSVVIAVMFLIILLVVRDISLGIAMLFLGVYIAGNGIIHVRHTELTRDVIIEYALVGGIALVLVVSSFGSFLR